MMLLMNFEIVRLPYAGSGVESLRAIRARLGTASLRGLSYLVLGQLPVLGSLSVAWSAPGARESFCRLVDSRRSGVLTRIEALPRFQWVGSASTMIHLLTSSYSARVSTPLQMRFYAFGFLVPYRERPCLRLA